MKAILVIDMPKSCDCCRFCTVNIEHSVICDLTKKYLGMADVIPDECPLRPMPLKRETRVYWKSVGLGNIPTHEISDYDKGWNDCVDFLESEDER